MPSTKDLTPKDRLAVALDLPNEHEALKLVDRLGQTCQWYKVGMELYYAAARQILDRALVEGPRPPTLKWHFEPEENNLGMDRTTTGTL